MNNEEVKNLRLKKGVTQREVASATGLTEKTLYDIEAGRSEYPNLKTVQKIAGYYGVPVADLIEDK